MAYFHTRMELVLFLFLIRAACEYILAYYGSVPDSFLLIYSLTFFYYYCWDVIFNTKEYFVPLNWRLVGGFGNGNTAVIACMAILALLWLYRELDDSLMAIA